MEFEPENGLEYVTALISSEAQNGSIVLAPFSLQRVESITRERILPAKEITPRPAQFQPASNIYGYSVARGRTHQAHAIFLAVAG